MQYHYWKHKFEEVNWTHQHLSSSSVIRMLFPVSSVPPPAVPQFVFTNHYFFFPPSLQFVLVNAILFPLSPQFMLVNDVFPTSPQFVFDWFFIPNDTCYRWTSFVLRNTFVVTVKSYLVHSNNTACHSELHITGLNGKNVTFEAKNIAAINIFN